MAEIFGPYSDRLIPSDNPAILCGALQQALDENPEDQDRKSLQLADYIATRFSLSRMVDGVIDGYRMVLAARVQS